MNQAVESVKVVGHAVLRLADIKPEVNLAFSPNLYLWLKEYGHFFRDGGLLHSVYRVKPSTTTAKEYGAGTLFIGYRTQDVDGNPQDMAFVGCRLMPVLCQGRKVSSWCYSGMADDLELVDGFWDRYLGVGRCAVDPVHQGHFMGERYAEKGDERTCLWCGAKHKKETRSRVVNFDVWVDA